MQFLTIEGATSYIKSNLQDFYNNSRVLRDRMLVIGRLLNTAKQKNNQSALGQLIVLRQQTKDAFLEQLRIEQELMPFAQYFGINVTLGMLPIILGVTAATVAASMYVMIQKVRTQGQALDMVAKGLLTPAEAAKITDGTVIGLGGGFAFGMPLAILAGAIFIWVGGLNLRGAIK